MTESDANPLIGETKEVYEDDNAFEPNSLFENGTSISTDANPDIPITGSNSATIKIKRNEPTLKIAIDLTQDNLVKSAPMPVHSHLVGLPGVPISQLDFGRPETMSNVVRSFNNITNNSIMVNHMLPSDDELANIVVHSASNIPYPYQRRKRGRPPKADKSPSQSPPQMHPHSPQIMHPINQFGTGPMVPAPVFIWHNQGKRTVPPVIAARPPLGPSFSSLKQPDVVHFTSTPPVATPATSNNDSMKKLKPNNSSSTDVTVPITTSLKTPEIVLKKTEPVSMNNNIKEPSSPIPNANNNSTSKIIPFPDPACTTIEEDKYLRAGKLHGIIEGENSAFSGTFEGAPGLGYLVEFTINDQTFKGFVLNTLDYSSSVNIDISKIKLPSESKFSSHEEKGIEGLVELGRSVVATNVTKAPTDSPKLPLVSNPVQNISKKVEEPFRWECYYDSCSTIFTGFAALTEHMKAHHASQQSIRA